ncbi:MAG TPA: DoxX family protein [Stellaceae bacterium]|nr:DoxX family protein [Stellaceae bacterium]
MARGAPRRWSHSFLSRHGQDRSRRRRDGQHDQERHSAVAIGARRLHRDHQRDHRPFSVAIGFFTRFFAAACAIDLAVITFDVLWPKGFVWSQGGYEFMLMWGLIMFAIALRGGGPYSVDRWIGREL